MNEDSKEWFELGREGGFKKGFMLGIGIMFLAWVGYILITNL